MMHLWYANDRCSMHRFIHSESQTSSVFLTLLGDESIDAIKLNGAYYLPYMIINIDRTRPIVVRPAVGATVIFSGDVASPDPQF